MKKINQAENYSSSLLKELINDISPEQQKNIDRKMMLAAKIYDAMKAKGWNQKQFAEAMGKKQSEICRWLSGTHTFNSDTLWAIGDTLNIDLLPVQEKQKVVEIKYVPVVIAAEMSQPVKDGTTPRATIYDKSVFNCYAEDILVNSYAQFNFQYAKA